MDTGDGINLQEGTRYLSDSLGVFLVRGRQDTEVRSLYNGPGL
jgi:hypothetical protein